MTSTSFLSAICLSIVALVSTAAEEPSLASSANSGTVVRVAPEDNYPPFSFMQDGTWQGLSADMIGLMQVHMSEHFQILPATNLDQIFTHVRQGNADVVTSVKETPERSRFLSFTPPYIKVPTVILIRSGTNPGAWPQSFSGKSVAVGRGYGVQRYLEQNYPSVHLTLVDDDLDGLRQLSFAAVDAVIMDTASASYLTTREKLTNIRVLSGFEYTYDLSFAVRKDLPLLREHMTQALEAIAQSDKDALFHKWIPIAEDPGTLFQTAFLRVMPVLAYLLLAICIAGILGWSVHRRRRRAERAASVYARNLIEASLDPLVTINPDGKITDVNAATEKVTGLTRQQLIGSDFADYFTSPASARAGYRMAFEKGFVTDYPLAIRHVSGQITEVIYNANVYRNELGQVMGVFAAARDVTARNRAESLVQAASVFSHTREGILICSANTLVINVNGAFTRITGFEAADVMGRPPALLHSRQHDSAFYAALWNELTERSQWHGEVWDRRRDGTLFAAALTITAVPDDAGRVGHYVLLFSDVTALREHQQQLENLAHFDTLTGLPNRLLLADRLRQGLVQTERRKQILAVAYLDLDGFKAVNDAHGHAIGDQLLVEVSERLTQVLREGDTFGRLGGDEFVAVIVDLENKEDAVPILERMLQAASQPVRHGNLTLHVSVSIGVAYYPQAAETDAEHLLRQADQAMYQAKLSGKNRYAVFDSENDLSQRGHHANLERIRQALADGELVLHYQPKVNMRTRVLVGVEALIRWQHPQRGLLAPAHFLPQIENHPLSVQVGEWVIRQALQQLVIWQKENRCIPISVNIGAMQLQQSDFVERLNAALAEYDNIPANSLQLEILETRALEEIDRVSHYIRQCGQLGVGFALDDFGTGYSSLTYLKQLPIPLIKIDQGFVRDLLIDTDNRVILDGILWIMRQLGREAIAEGVETLEHGAMLMDLGCELAQGYGIGRPMAVEALDAWERKWHLDSGWEAVSKVPRTAV